MVVRAWATHTLPLSPQACVARSAEMKALFLTYPRRGYYREAKSSYLTLDPNDLDLSENEPPKGKSGVNLHPPTNFGGDWTKDLGGVGT